MVLSWVCSNGSGQISQESEGFSGIDTEEDSSGGTWFLLLSGNSYDVVHQSTYMPLYGSVFLYYNMADEF